MTRNVFPFIRTIIIGVVFISGCDRQAHDKYGVDLAPIVEQIELNKVFFDEFSLYSDDEKSEQAKALYLKYKSAQYERSEFNEQNWRTYLTYQKYYARQHQAVYQPGVAIELLEEAIEISEAIFGKNNHFAAQFYLEKGATYAWMGEHAQGLEDLKNALWLIESAHPGVNAQTYIYYFAVAELLQSLGQFSEALSLLNELDSNWKVDFDHLNRDRPRIHHHKVKMMIYQSHYMNDEMIKARQVIRDLLKEPKLDDYLIDEEIVSLHTMLGYTFDQPNELDQQITALNTYLESHDSLLNEAELSEQYTPHYEEAMRTLAAGYRSTFDFTGAENIYKRHIKHLQNGTNDAIQGEAILLDRLASLYSDYGLFEQSKKTASQANGIRLSLQRQDIDNKNIDGIMKHVIYQLNYPVQLARSGFQLEAINEFNKTQITLDKIIADYPVIKLALSTLYADFYQQIGDFPAAEKEYNKAIHLLSVESNPVHLISTKYKLTNVLIELNKFSEAQALLAELEHETTETVVSLQSVNILNLSGSIHRKAADFELAEAYYLEAHASTSQMYGHNHPKTAKSLLRLSTFYNQTQLLKSDKIIELLKAAEAIFKNHGNGQQLDRARTYLAMSSSYLVIGDNNNSLLQVNKAVDILSKAFEHHAPNILSEILTATNLLLKNSQATSAERLLTQVQERIITLHGKQHRYFIEITLQLANLYGSNGNLNKAQNYFTLARETAEYVYQSGDPLLIQVYEELARFHLQQGQIDEYSLYLSKAGAGRTYTLFQDINDGRSLDQSIQLRASRHGTAIAAIQRSSTPEQLRIEVSKAFESAQNQHLSSSSFALELNRHLHKTKDKAIKTQIQKWQRLRNERQVLSLKFHAAQQAERQLDNNSVSLTLAREFKDISKSKAAIANELQAYFSANANTEFHKIYSLQEIQDELDDGEALLLVRNTRDGANHPGGLFLWEITATNAMVRRQPISIQIMSTLTQRLRCGLDIGRWDAKNSPCWQWYPTFLRAKSRPAFDTLPFDVTLANTLYQTLFGQLSHDIKTVHVVAEGPVSQLPLNVLVQSRQSTNSADTAYFVDRYSHSVSPSVSAFMDARTGGNAIKSKSPARYVGIGNPLLVGETEHPVTGPSARESAAKARQFRNCQIALERPSAWNKLFSALSRNSRLNFSENGEINQAELNKLAPLPESAIELCTVNKNFSDNDDNILLATKATETAVKALSSTDMFDTADILHFATHAIISNSQDPRQSGIVLTPPQTQATLVDDGFLSTYEIAKLNLNVDWVILSACNTGTSLANDPQLFGGLGEAFLNANARSLLVSNWAVASSAAVELTTSLFENYSANGVSRIDALRDAILSVKNLGGVKSHPAYWGPFTLIGDHK